MTRFQGWSQVPPKEDLQINVYNPQKKHLNPVGSHECCFGFSRAALKKHHHHHHAWRTPNECPVRLRMRNWGRSGSEKRTTFGGGGRIIFPKVPEEKFMLQGRRLRISILIWLVVSTHLKNVSQNGNLPQIGVKKNMKPPPSNVIWCRNFCPWIILWKGHPLYRNGDF